eukprot:scaffold229546_cov31-Attheya_sp.AAC.1
MADEETPDLSMAADVLLTLGDITIDNARVSSDATSAELSSLIPVLLGKFDSNKVTMHYKRIPVALLQDVVQTLNDKLIVVNYWRGLSKLEQETLFKELRTY